MDGRDVISVMGRNNHWLSVVLLAVVSCFNPLHAQVDEIEKVVASYVEAREGKDEEALRKLFSKDADQLVSSGTWRLGLEEMIPGMLQSSSRNPGDRIIEVERTRFPHPDVAIADASYTIKGTDGSPDRNMWSTFIMVKENDQWLITAIRNMLPAAGR